MLCEALTQFPHSLVFNEPNIGANRFIIRPSEEQLIRDLGIDIRTFVRHWSILSGRFLPFGFRHVLTPRICRHVSQIGIKEIFHKDWKRTLRLFPDMRVVLTARDPRDIYLSLHSRYVTGSAIWQGEFTAERVASSLNEEFGHQREMATALSVLKVRYEDLCTNRDSIGRVLEFVDSDIDSLGPLGGFLESDRSRVQESVIHAGQITDRRVARWQREPNAELVAQAHQVFQYMSEYRKFWGYDD